MGHPDEPTEIPYIVGTMYGGVHFTPPTEKSLEDSYEIPIPDDKKATDADNQEKAPTKRIRSTRS